MNINKLNIVYFLIYIYYILNNKNNSKNINIKYNN